jgi:DNA-binding MarR family transcriptional regulator
MYLLDKVRNLISTGQVGILSALTLSDSGKSVGLSVQSVQSVLRKLVYDGYIEKLVGAKSMANGEYLYVTAKNIPKLESEFDTYTVEPKEAGTYQVAVDVSNTKEVIALEPIVTVEEHTLLSNVQILYNCQDMWFELINLAKNLEIKELHPTAVLAIEGAMSTYSESIVDALCNLNLKSKEV